MKKIKCISVFLLVACAGVFVAAAGPPVSAQQELSSGSGSIPTCSIQAPVPGTYTTFEVAGQVRQGTFTAASASSHWAQARWVVSGPVATAQPTGAPIASYVYYGTYALKEHKMRGCAYVSTSVDGSSYPTTKFNAAAEGTQNFATLAKEKPPLFTGHVKGSVTGLSKTGGSGTLTLIAKNGLTFDTATITLTGRVRTP